MLEEKSNELYPIFLKINRLNVLIIGGGKVALEKLHFLLKSSPNAHVEMVAIEFSSEIKSLAKYKDIELIERSFNPLYIRHKHIVIAATNQMDVNLQAYRTCKQAGVLINVADNPKYCDFYLGGIVTKGHVKIAISTNGKSPTMAKRLRQYFEEVIPQDINELVEHLHTIRKQVKGDFKEKVETLNKMTQTIITKTND